MNEAKWIHWCSQFRVTLTSQGLNPVSDTTHTPDETNEGIEFTRMQATVFGILKTQVQINTGKAIIRNHQDSMDTRAALAELVTHCRTSTRAIAVEHVLHQEPLTLKLTKDMRVSQHEFPSGCSDTVCNCPEHTHGREEAQMSQPQLLSCLQEAVSLDRDLNQLRHDEMFRMLQGKLPWYSLNTWTHSTT
jgi:hypothetical protein